MILTGLALPNREEFMKKLFNLILVIVIVITLASCGNSKKGISKQVAEVYTDFMQRQVSIPKPVNKIVSMAPNATEMLFAIGLDKEIVGVTRFCDYPEAAKQKTKIGGYYDPNVEVILSLAPDLIVATPDGYSYERVGKLEQAGIPVFLINPKSVDDVLDSMIALGKITGKSDFAGKIVPGLRLRVQKVKESVKSIPVDKRPKVFYEIGQDPLITVGPGNFVDNLISMAGGINIASDAPAEWPRYSVEAVIEKKPDIIITTPYAMSGKADEKVLDNNIWKRYRTMPAVKNNRIYQVNPDIVMRSGPRIVDGMEKLHSLFVAVKF
jgi:iron complex transport system substrate-binding protein